MGRSSLLTFFLYPVGYLKTAILFLPYWICSCAWQKTLPTMRKSQKSPLSTAWEELSIGRSFNAGGQSKMYRCRWDRRGKRRRSTPRYPYLLSRVSTPCHPQTTAKRYRYLGGRAVPAADAPVTVHMRLLRSNRESSGTGSVWFDKGLRMFFIFNITKSLERIPKSR